MSELEKKYQALVAQGWSGMLFLLLTMFITDLVELSLPGDFKALSMRLSLDPGMVGLWVLAGIICLNVVGQMAIRAVYKRSCRWWVFGVTVAYVAFFLLHQIVHLLNGEGFDIHFILDTTHHVVGFWAIWAAYRWARLATRDHDDSPAPLLFN